MDANSVVWQIGEMGKLDLGGGGTVAKYVANQDIDTIDIGVPVLSMHSPFEIVSKADVYMAYLTFKAFCEDAGKLHPRDSNKIFVRVLTYPGKSV